MSVEKKLRTTIATLEGITADFTVSYLESSDIQTKQMFQQLSSQTERVLDKLKNRMNEIEKDEPEYKEEKI